MGFYEEISKYYDYIFPAGKQQLAFIREAAGVPEKRILDVACGSGGYSVELAADGYDVTATDLDEKMIELTRKKAAGRDVPVEALTLDMRRLKASISGGFNVIFCIGNSLVHLGSTEEIGDVLGQMGSMLAPDGSLILQVINYDRIMKLGISELPAIRNEEIGLEFIRRYSIKQGGKLIDFNTVLTVGAGETKEEYTNSVELYPLMSRDLSDLLQASGFSRIDLYGDFAKTPYNPDTSFMLVVRSCI